MHSPNNRAGKIDQLLVFVGLALAAALGPGCQTGNEKAELAALEGALGSLANAPKEDRGIRLQALQEVPIETERLVALKQICVASHQRFYQAERLLAEAREQTQGVEAMLVQARQRRADGHELDRKEELRIRESADRAAASLKGSTQALDQAEKLIVSCKEERIALKALIQER
jgi:hypothetical protein